MICIYGQAGNGKSFAVNASLRELAPTLIRRIQFRARPSTRDLRHELFHVLGLPGRPPSHAIEFDRMLRGALEEPRVLVCDEASRLETVSGPPGLGRHNRDAASPTIAGTALTSCHRQVGHDSPKSRDLGADWQSLAAMSSGALS
jgi:hypothetical protein